MTRPPAASIVIAFLACSLTTSTVSAQERRPITADIADLWRRFSDQWHRTPYALDEQSRRPSAGADGHSSCPEVTVVTHEGGAVEYDRPVSVNPYFRTRLRLFEDLVASTAREVYGRAPARIVHRGTHVCRNVRGSDHRLSEHALANAIDVAAFEWDRADGGGADGGAFTVSVEKHWSGVEGERHAAFLRTLVGRLRQQKVFRGMIVPPAEGHDDHFHFDMGRWVYFEGEDA